MINTQNGRRLGLADAEEGEGRVRAGAPEKCDNIDYKPVEGAAEDGGRATCGRGKRSESAGGWKGKERRDRALTGPSTVIGAA